MKDIHTVNINLLVILETILRMGSVTAAAESLHLTQSAVSHALRKLRILFKDPLFVQQGHKLQPTSLALDLYPRLQRFVSDVQELVFEPPRFDPLRSEKDFHFAGLDYLDMLLVPRIYGLMSRQSPLCNLRVHRPTGNDMNRMLEENPGFSVVGVGARPSSDILEKTLWPDTFMLATSRHHPLARKQSISLEDFTACNHALIGTGSLERSIVDEALEAVGQKRRTAVAVPSFLSIPLLVSQSDLIVTAPQRCLKTLAQQLPLKLYKTPLKLPGFTMKLFWHRRYDRDPAQKFFRQLILAAAQDIRSEDQAAVL